VDDASKNTEAGFGITAKQVKVLFFLPERISAPRFLGLEIGVFFS
jgi:hypothetical protein